MLKVYCPHCKELLNLKRPSTSGRHAYRCPKCAKVFAINVNAEPEQTEESKQEENKTHEVKSGKGDILVLCQKRRFRSDIEYKLKLGENTIGAMSDKKPSTIMVKDDYMSRRSAQITVSMVDRTNTFKYEFRLLHATNPCYLKGKVVSEGTSLYLSSGDEFQLGKTVFYMKTYEA